MDIKEKIAAFESLKKSILGAELTKTVKAQQDLIIDEILCNPMKSLDDVISLIQSSGKLKQIQSDLFEETIQRLKLEIK